MKAFLEQVRAHPLRVAVLGDVLIDEYIQGEYTRFAAETGQPILHSSSDERLRVAGGAGNLARQFRRWNVQVELIGFLDIDAVAVLEREQHVGTSACTLLVNGCHNPVKRRYLASRQCIFRQDVETLNYGLGPAIDKARWHALRSLRDILPRVQAVVISDYDKGLLDEHAAREAIAACKVAGVRTYVDPKDKAPVIYDGCHVFKPNESYRRRFRSLAGEICVWTSAEHPPVVIDERGDYTCRPRPPIEARHLPGAGDCFLAALVVAMEHGLGPRAAAEIAYSAGRCYVQGQANRPVLPAEAIRDLDPIEGKLVDVAELQAMRLSGAFAGKRLIFTNGCFDVLHPGHVHTLAWAKSRGDVLIVAVNEDADVRSLKGEHRPHLALPERSRMLAALGFVDFVLPFSHGSLDGLVKELRPDELVKGPEYRGQAVPGSEHVPVAFAPDSPFPMHSSGFAPLQQNAPT